MANGRDFLILVRIRTDLRQTKEEAQRRFHGWLETHGHTSVASGFDLIETLKFTERKPRKAKAKAKPTKSKTKAAPDTTEVAHVG